MNDKQILMLPRDHSSELIKNLYVKYILPVLLFYISKLFGRGKKLGTVSREEKR